MRDALEAREERGAPPVTVALDVKGLGTMNVTIGGELFAGSLGGWHVQSADVGGNWSKGGTNLSGLKLTYTPKNGTYKGSFNVYALEGAGKSTKLKKYKLSVSGVVVNGTGYGTAVCKKPALNWTVAVR